MLILVPITLFGWIPAVLLLIAFLPPRRAVIVAFISAWLFLPGTGYSLPGLPDYTKVSATGLGILLGTALFNNRLLLGLRPRWFDLPMAVWTLCPIASSLSNGLGLYDGLSESFASFVMWGMPYLIGRVYFTRLEHLRELAVGIVAGGLVYVPFCLFEMRMSPQLQMMVYGLPHHWGEIVYGGYRPQVFMSCALELGTWMAAAAMTGIWLWASGAVKTLRNYPFGRMLLVLVITAVMCKVAGAWFSLILGVSLWFGLKWTRRRLPALVLILLPTLYILTRSLGLWSGDGAVKLVEQVLNERRAGSLDFRMRNEDILAVKALKKPIFGWGGWGRNRVYDDAGRDVSITDGMWIIALGNNGLVGLTSFYAALLLPMGLLVRRNPPSLWLTPTMAPACVLAALTNIYAIDCLANGMVNPIYMFALGGVTGVLGPLDRRGIIQQATAAKSDLHDIIHKSFDTIDSQTLRSDPKSPAGSDPREVEAIRLVILGRSLMEQGMVRESEEAWHSALEHWATLAADYPDDPEYRRCWLDGLNDWAWSLVSGTGREAHDVARAIQLAEETVTLEPDSAAYWNTLGIAYFRGGHWEAAIRALECSVELSVGGTGFDHFFLALAYRQGGDREQAQHWYLRANAWMEEHNPDHGELVRFRAEVAVILGLEAGPMPTLGKGASARR